MVERLARLPETSDPLVNPYLVGRAAEIYRARRDAARTPRERLELTMQYATALLNDGQTPAALRALDDYDRMLNDPALTPTLEIASKFFETKAVAFLRLAEQENCLVNHNADSCLLPIRGGGVHIRPQGSRGAIQVLSEWLEIAPNPNAAWLLNIAHMTLGEYPDQVPSRWLIPPKAFESSGDIRRFPDVAGALGVDVDDLAGGLALEDFDRDGLLDFVVSAAGLHSQIRFFRNCGDGTFSDLTESAGLLGITGGLNINHADYNNDGYPDILVLRGGWQGNDGQYPNSLLRNNGDNTFTDVTEEAGLLSFHPTQTATWLDFDGDGWLDLFIGNESIPPLGQVHPCELYRNNGDGTFTECAEQNGVAFVEFVKGVASGDYNNDGRPDLYLSSRGFPNRLLRNDGPAGDDGSPGARWRFTDVTREAGVAEPLQSFPCWFFDYDNDGWLDLFVAGYFIANAGDVAADVIGAANRGERARLYRNNGDGTFADVTKTAGVFQVLLTMGCNFGDLDNDGLLDFYLGTGDPYLGTLIPNRMFRNDGQGRFQDVTTSGGFGQLQKGHAIGFGDINNDGPQDIYSVVGGVYSGDHYHNQLFANPGHGNRWLKLSLTGTSSNRMAMGARVKVVVRTAHGEREIHRTVGTGSSFGSAPLRQEIGLGAAAEISRVEIFWPVTKLTQVLTGLQVDRAYAIREGDAEAQEVKLARFAWPANGGGSHQHHGGGHHGH
jgi:ASPIC and UnbV.